MTVVRIDRGKAMPAGEQSAGIAVNGSAAMEFLCGAPR
jgi:hypothetical protein